MSINSVPSFTGVEPTTQPQRKQPDASVPLGLTGLLAGFLVPKYAFPQLVTDKVEFSNATLEDFKKVADSNAFGKLTAEQQGIVKEGIGLLEGSPAATTVPTATTVSATQSGIKAMTEQEMKTFLSTELPRLGYNGNLERINVSRLTNGTNLDLFTTQILNPGAERVATETANLTHARNLDAIAQEEVGSLQRRLSAMMIYNPATDANTLLRQSLDDYAYINNQANRNAADFQLRTNRYNAFYDAHHNRVLELGTLGTYGPNGTGNGRIGELQTRLAASRGIEGMDVTQLENELDSALERRWALLNQTYDNPALQSMIGDAEREAVRLDREAAAERARAAAKRAEANAIDPTARAAVDAEATRLEALADARAQRATRAHAVVADLANPNALRNNQAINGITGTEAAARGNRTATSGNITNIERNLKEATQRHAVNEACAELAAEAKAKGFADVTKETASKAITEKVNSKLGTLVQDTATAAKDGKTSVAEALKKLPETFKGKYEKIAEAVRKGNLGKSLAFVFGAGLVFWGLGKMFAPKEAN